MYKKITRDELDVFLRKHKLWLIDDPEGERANFQGANLWGANLQGADLQGADLRGANLQRANLQGANLWGANLYRANLWGADLQGANLRGADLQGADLRGADLRGANLQRADLRGAKNINYPINCPEKGSFVGFKKASDYIVELLIPEDANRCSATTRKCRCSKAKVISITNIDGSDASVNTVSSNRDPDFHYTVGEVVAVDNFDQNRWNECSTGIHFFITRQEAVEY